MAAGPLSSSSRRRRSSDIRSTDLRWPPSQNAAAHMRARVPNFFLGGSRRSTPATPGTRRRSPPGCGSVPSKMSRARRRVSSALGADFQMLSEGGASRITVPLPGARRAEFACR